MREGRDDVAFRGTAVLTEKPGRRSGPTKAPSCTHRVPFLWYLQVRMQA
jgi:hypothetical protein